MSDQFKALILNQEGENFSREVKLIDKKVKPRGKLTVNTTVGFGSTWLTPRINKFAEITEDPQFIHIDPERAKQLSPFGKTIAHGFLVLSLASKFAIVVLPKTSSRIVRINYGFNKVRL